MSEFVRNVLVEQRKRLVGTVMSHLEANVYPKLTVTERKELRDKVLTAVGAYHDICLDMLKASVTDGSVVNEEAVRLMAELNHRLQQRQGT